MITPPTPIGEAARLRALASAGVLFTPGEARFDRITRLACSTFEAPIALVTLVADRIQWFKSAQGLVTPETSREVSFCGHAIVERAPLIVCDTWLDSRFFDNSLVVGPPYIRFYAGQPVSFRGQPIGTLCVIDTRPRSFDAAQREHLRALGAWVENELNAQALSEAQRSLLGQLDDDGRRALLDAPTRCWNAAAAEPLLQAELQRAERHGAPMALLMIDVALDAAAAGDDAAALIPTLAQQLRSSVRPSDALLRLDARRFALLLSDVAAAQVNEIANRVLANLSMAPLPPGVREMRVDATLGAATLAAARADAGPLLMSAAQAALADARARGPGAIALREARDDRLSGPPPASVRIDRVSH